MDALHHATGATKERVQEVVGAWIREVTKDKPYSSQLQPFDKENLAFKFFLVSFIAPKLVLKKAKAAPATVAKVRGAMDSMATCPSVIADSGFSVCVCVYFCMCVCL
jgi:hypothetical protein